MISGYRISTQSEEMDIKIIHGYLSHSYWAKNIPIDVVAKAIENSLCFGVFAELDNGEEEQIAFARMITDKATFAYLSDVFVLEEHRGKGISKWLMQEIMDHPQLQGIRRMMLATADAHALYQKSGFKKLSSPDFFMELHHADIYQ